MAEKKRPVRRKPKLPDFGAEVERLAAERYAAEAEASGLGAQWREKYMPEIKELIRYGEKRKHAWTVGRTGVFSPRTQEEQAAPSPTREEVMLHMFYGMADERNRSSELGYEIERLKRQIKEAWETLRLFSGGRMAGVINLKDRPRPDSSAYVYIGRGQRAGKEYFPRSKWANLYTVKRYGRAEALARYEQKIRNGPLWDELPELEGKTLACWCKPEACHGDVLLRLVAERSGSE
jgi:hypothetical protein